MYYSEIKFCDIADGVGVRTTLFVSGCRNHCEGCFQPQTWSFDNGRPFTEETQDRIIESMSPDYIAGLTLLGGEPFEEENQAALLPFMKRFKAECPQKDVWAFTGYLLDDLLPGGRKHTEYTEGLLDTIDILVDGPFVLSRRNLMLRFRGSENQRILNLRETLKAKKAILWDGCEDRA